MVNVWKVTAIMFIIYSVLLTSLIVWGVILVAEDNAAINDCYYNTCEQYPEASWDEGVCICYDINEYGEYEVAETSYK